MQKIFIFVNGILVAAGVFLFLRWFLNREESGFRDDHWLRGGKPRGFQPGRPWANRVLLEEKIDRKILLGYQPEPGAEPEEPARSAFRTPHFHGKPHEVLGVPADADESTVNAAFRHWMKCYHPDRVTHLGPEFVEQARRRAEQLNTARAAMLQK